MSFFLWNIAAALVGFALDLRIGDPEGWPHPVIWMGRWIAFLEKRLRRRGGNLRAGAVWLTASTVAISMAVTACALWLLGLIHPASRFAGMCVVSWWALSAKCLAVEGRGAFVYPSHAPFLLADFGRPVRPIAEVLKKRGILVRECMDFEDADDGAHLRFAVRTESENGRLVEELREAMACAGNH